MSTLFRLDLFMQRQKKFESLVNNDALSAAADLCILAAASVEYRPNVAIVPVHPWVPTQPDDRRFETLYL